MTCSKNAIKHLKMVSSIVENHYWVIRMLPAGSTGTRTADKTVDHTSLQFETGRNEQRLLIILLKIATVQGSLLAALKKNTRSIFWVNYLLGVLIGVMLVGLWIRGTLSLRLKEIKRDISWNSSSIWCIRGRFTTVRIPKNTHLLKLAIFFRALKPKRRGNLKIVPSKEENPHLKRYSLIYLLMGLVGVMLIRLWIIWTSILRLGEIKTEREGP